MYFHKCMVVTKTSTSLGMGTVPSSHTISYECNRKVATDTVLKLSVGTLNNLF